METASVAASASPSPYTYSLNQSQYNQNALIIDATLGEPGEEKEAATVDFNRLALGLSLTADEIIEKLNAQLKDKVPGGIESLKPEDYTPDKTASSIVDSITGLFAAYQKSNPDLDPEELISRFMKAARSGVEQGYDDAYQTLDGLGAFEFDNVKSSIEETRTLIASKLDAFEAAKRDELGVDPQQSIASATSTAVKTQAALSLAA